MNFIKVMRYLCFQAAVITALETAIFINAAVNSEPMQTLFVYLLVSVFCACGYDVTKHLAAEVEAIVIEAKL